MPPPAKPYCFGTAGLSTDEIAKIDPDYLFFLSHVRLDGVTYTVEIPSKDGASPPQVIKYEETLEGPNAEPPATAGREGGVQGSPSPMEEDSSAAGEVPSGGASPPASVKTRAASHVGEVPVEEDDLAAPAAEPAWYDSEPHMDEDYRHCLQHVRVVNDARMVYEMGDFSMTIGEEREAEAEAEEEEDADAAIDDNEEEGEVEAEEADEAIPASKEDDVGTEKNEDSDENEEGVASDFKELQGAIWPTHIVERPESDFKQKLMEVLKKPFNQEEHDELFGMATNRTPVKKERRTRHRVVNYACTYEMGKSYFDCYPDLADQVEGEGNSYPNRLALLRGLFFWLKNIGHEDQFRPWRDDYKKYRVFYEN
ncbi:uncharacterized protein LOC133888153 [Phragmites australis]|uniref:uncharacterized protein LOC133888153 n=1 Tax=Phragmites australis TaxID=29695 RepID=UPI002D77DA6E|nr:uncharacterized protein LOC133888153 [Phragmites australis]